MTDPTHPLRAFPFLASVPDDQFLAIVGQLHELSLPSGTPLFRQGDAGDALYLIVDGSLDIIQDGVRIVTRGPGEVVGEFAVVDGNRRSADVTAATPARLLRWSREDFQGAIRESLEVTVGILAVITAKLRKLPASHRPTATSSTPVIADTQIVTLPATGLRQQKTILFRSTAMRRIVDLANRIARSRSHAFITGESGSGKELIARLIHEQSHFRNGPFVAINCGAIPESLAESELFGHERGAFTSAVNTHQGCFEQASGGSLFLDEVGELALSTQAKLLRVLDDGVFLRVGGMRPIIVQVRIVAATNRNPKEDVQAGRFRKDLFYRLNAAPIHIPPLRERTEDIPPLVSHFLADVAANTATKQLASEGMAYLMAQPWYGNVRELRNVVERAVLLADGDELSLDVLTACVHEYADLEGVAPPATEEAADDFVDLIQRTRAQSGTTDLLELVEGALIQKALHQAHGVQSKAADLLGIDRRSMARRLKKFGFVDGN